MRRILWCKFASVFVLLHSVADPGGAGGAPSNAVVDLCLGPLALVWDESYFFVIGFNSLVFNRFLIIKTVSQLETRF